MQLQTKALDEINNIGQNALNIAILIVVIWIVFLVVAAIIRAINVRAASFRLTFLHVKLPKDNEIEIKAAEHMFTSLYGFKKNFFAELFTGPYRISFEIVSKSTGIGFYVVAPSEIAPLVEKQINGAYPSAEIDIVKPQEIWDRGKYTQIEEIKLKGASYYPLKGYEDIKGDPLNILTSAISKLGENEVIAIQYVIQPAPNTWRMEGHRFINSIKAKSSDPEKKVNVDTSFLEGVEKKIANSGFYTKIRLVAIADDNFTAKANIQNLVGAFEQFTDVNYNKFVTRFKFFSYTRHRMLDQFIYREISVREIAIPVFDITLYSNTSVLNTVELATIMHFPNKNVETPNIIWLGARRAAAPNNLPDAGLYLGKSIFRGIEKEVFMKEDDRKRHFYIIGQTGTGKSEFMMSLALQDIYHGEGVAIMDPHGSDIDKLLERIPPHRRDDVILFDAAETERPIGLNLLEAHSEEEKHMAINFFIELLYKLYDPNKQGIMGPQLERALRNSMLTAMVDPESTLVDVMRLLIDEKYSERFLPGISDPMVLRYWEEVSKTTQNRKGETLGYYVSKLDRFITEITLRRIIGQSKSTINMREIMAQKKILLIDLAKGKIGEENSNFIGLLLVPKLLMAALARHELLGKVEFPNFFLYVDEFQNFATPAFATILSEARKYKLCLIVAHQFIAQLTDDIKNAIFGNVGTKAIFRVGTEDAEHLETYFAPTFTKADISNLPMGNCYMQLLMNGQPTPPFSIKVEWDKEASTVKYPANFDIKILPKDPEMAKWIRENSKQKYGTPIAEIEAKIKERGGFEDKKEELPPLPNLPF